MDNPITEDTKTDSNFLSTDFLHQSTRVALSTFRRISDLWALNDQQKTAMMDIDSMETIQVWEQNNDPLPTEQLDRLSHMTTIYMLTHVLIQVRDTANHWIREEGTREFFNGQTAIEMMTSRNIADLVKVEKYLRAQV